LLIWILESQPKKQGIKSTNSTYVRDKYVILPQYGTYRKRNTILGCVEIAKIAATWKLAKLAKTKKYPGLGDLNQGPISRSQSSRSLHHHPATSVSLAAPHKSTQHIIIAPRPIRVRSAAPTS
jgi:hypothetical protein